MNGIISEMRQALCEAEARLAYTHRLLRELRELQNAPHEDCGDPGCCPDNPQDVCADCGCGAGEHHAHCTRLVEGLFDYAHEDAISYDVPEGYDTILGYLAKNHPDVLDTFDYSVPEATQRDGFKLSYWAKRYDPLRTVYVEAPKCLQNKDIYTVRAYPVSLLQQRWG